jgi:thiol-disulfide isomerase/thioredoxin
MAQLPFRPVSLLLITFWVSSTLCLSGRESLNIPRPAPMFVLPTWDGKVLKSASLKGQVVVLEFFQTWCPDCQQS